MMALFAPLFRQSLRTTGIYLLIVALVLAISATTALKFSNQQMQNAVTLQAAEMLAADAELSDQVPIEASWKQHAQQLNLSTTEVTTFSTMAHTDAEFVMVSVKAVESNFPLRGAVDIHPQSQPLRSGEVWLSPRALDLLQVKVGQFVHIADAQLKVTAKIEHDANQELGFNGLSPAVIMSHQDVPMTNAIQVGSRVEYRLLIAGDPKHIQEIQDQFEQQKTKEGTLKLKTADDSDRRIMRSMQNLDTFLQLSNILTILLSGIAIALTSQRYIQQNQDHIALLRCMGATRQQILKVYFALLMVVVAVAVVLGSIGGTALGSGLLYLMLQMVPQVEAHFSMWDIVLGPLPMALLTSIVMLLGFVLPSIWQLVKTPPIRVIRQNASARLSILWMLCMGTLSLVAFSALLTGNIQLTAWVMGAIILLCTLLYGIVLALLLGLKRLKVGISAYIRIPHQTALQITALALSLSLIAVLGVLRTDILERLEQQLPQGTHNQFVYGLPPFDMPQFKQQLQEKNWDHSVLYPNIRGRLVAKNGQPFAPELIEKNNSLRRELNLTQAAIYPKENQIIQGEEKLLQKGDVSVELKTAQQLGIQVGDQLTFRLPEGDLVAKVRNLRTVEWETFSPNFFFIFAPETMDENAGSYLGSFYVNPEQRTDLVNVIQQFPNTVFIDMSLILNEIKRLMSIVIHIITILAVLVAISGFLVLLACLNLLMDERKKEVALMRAFGGSKQKMKWMLSFEIGFIGAIAGLVACLFAEVISAVVSHLMEIPIQPHAEIWLMLPLSMTVVCMLIGRYRLSYLSDLPPLQSLKELS